MEAYDDYVASYNYAISRKDADLKVHPGRYYSTMWELYDPVLSPFTGEYCSHLKTIPEWLWNKIVSAAKLRLEYNSFRKRGSLCPQTRDHLELIVSGKPPYGLSVV